MARKPNKIKGIGKARTESFTKERKAFLSALHYSNKKYGTNYKDPNIKSLSEIKSVDEFRSQMRYMKENRERVSAKTNMLTQKGVFVSQREYARAEKAVNRATQRGRKELEAENKRLAKLGLPLIKDLDYNANVPVAKRDIRLNAFKTDWKNPFDVGKSYERGLELFNKLIGRNKNPNNILEEHGQGYQSGLLQVIQHSFRRDGMKVQEAIQGMTGTELMDIVAQNPLLFDIGYIYDHAGDNRVLAQLHKVLGLGPAGQMA